MTELEFRDLVPKVGEIVYVCDRQEGHEFQLGEPVKVLKAKPQTDAYKCSNGKEIWWLTSGEFERKNNGR